MYGRYMYVRQRGTTPSPPPSPPQIDWFYQVCCNIMCTPPIHFHDWKILLRKYISNESPDVESNM